MSNSVTSTIIDSKLQVARMRDRRETMNCLEEVLATGVSALRRYAVWRRERCLSVMMLYDCVMRYGSRPMAKRPALVEKAPWRVLQASRWYLTAWGVVGGSGEEADTCILMEGVYKLGRHAASMQKHTFFVIARCTMHDDRHTLCFAIAFPKSHQ